MKKSLYFILLGLIGLTSCKEDASKNIDQNTIWTNFELFYDQNVDSTYVTAIFRINSEIGTFIQVTNANSVTFDGQEIAWHDNLGYHQNRVAGFIGNGTFEWTDEDGIQYSNTIEVNSIAIPNDFNTLYKTDSLSFFSWIGTALDSGEMVILTMGDTSQGNSRVFTIDTTGAITITLDSTKLNQLASGMIDLMLDRYTLPELNQETEVGGLLVGKYRATNGMVLLQDSL